MKIPCLGMDTELCSKCGGLGRKEIKLYPGNTPVIDIMADSLKDCCSECNGRGWKVTHEWLDAELIGV